MSQHLTHRTTSLVLARLGAINRTSKRTHFRRDFSGSRWSSSWKDGSIEFAVGGLLIATLTIDQALQYQDRLERKNVMNEIENFTRVGSYDDVAEMEEWLNREKPLFDCVVRTVPFSLDGYKCLKGIKVGDVVEVLEEQVGPGNMYNLCRTKEDSKSAKPIAAGWVPTKYLEKVPT